MIPAHSQDQQPEPKQQDPLETAADRFPKRPGYRYTYGTAGFRMEHSLLDPVLFRVGLLAVLRSRAVGGRAVGVMITASHNREQDNGVKVVEPMGEMLVQDWEAYATQLANAETSRDLRQVLETIPGWKGTGGKVIFARDTRPSGPRLVAALHAGIQALGGTATDCGEFTTPQLHYMVRCANDPAYGTPTELGYFDKLAAAYQRILRDCKPLSPMLVDCANGVGAPKLDMLAQRLPVLSVKPVNTDIRAPGMLNLDCGADFVKVEQRVPKGVSVEQSQQWRCCSLDGDADRIVFYYTDAQGTFQLLDGDKIAALAAGYLQELLHQIPALHGKVEIGVVQTAYANGSSTRYFEAKGIPVACTETGVKHLHHRAEEFPVGVYFEANGHGTVLFQPATVQLVKNAKVQGPKETRAQELLLAFMELINQTVGDALSDLLMVEGILAQRQWSFEQWAKGMYTDLPNRQLKVKVKDRSKFRTINADRQLAEPQGLQQALDALVATVKHGRTFVRPSGTEDVVRVYAEAETQDSCDALAYAVAQHVFDTAGGVGERPQRPK